MSTPERLVASQKANFDTLLAAQNAAFTGFEKLVDLHLKVAKATFDEVALKAQEAFDLKDSQEALAFVSAFGQPSAEKALAYSKHVYDILSGVQNELSQLGESQVAEQQRQVAEAVEHLAKNAPTGSESALALIKSSLANVNSAYDSVAKAAKQAAEVAETNINAATAATFKAASDSVAKTTRAPRKTAAA